MGPACRGSIVVIDTFAAASRANSCTVHGPTGFDDAAALVARVVDDNAPPDGIVACAANDPALRGLSFPIAHLVITPLDDEWQEQLARATVGVTGARLAVAEHGVVGLAC